MLSLELHGNLATVTYGGDLDVTASRGGIGFLFRCPDFFYTGISPWKCCQIRSDLENKFTMDEVIMKRTNCSDKEVGVGQLL